MSSASTPDAVQAMLRAEVMGVIVGTIFLAIGAAAGAIAAIRWRSGAQLLAWWGLWAGISGTGILIRQPAVQAVLPDVLRAAEPYASTAIAYLTLPVALLAWRELCVGRVRLILLWQIFAGLGIAVAGMAELILTGSTGRWMSYNNLLAAAALVFLLVGSTVPLFARTSFVLPPQRALKAGVLIFGVEGLYSSLARVLHYHASAIADWVGFGALLFSLGYVALQMIFANESRLVSIETELETARRIQSSILPASVPEHANLRIAACYRPMTDVAGDFYQFLPGDKNHLGVLVADVSGHGIPAALVSSMIKVAMQSVAAVAHDPAQVLSGLNRILSSETHGQFATAAYLWLDMEDHSALYSAAGHPPLLCWRGATGAMERIESNGLLFGIHRDAEYPVLRVPLSPSDRLLLYTDGVTEPENAAGEAFGDKQLERVVRENRAQGAAELSRHLLEELGKWQPAVKQQDDITLIVLDVI